MDIELKKKIDEVIKDSTEETVNEDYVKCKHILQNWEKENNVWLNVEEWAKHIEYISKGLNY